MIGNSTLTREQMIERIQILEELERRHRVDRLACFSPYHWQIKWYNSGLKYKQRLLMAANRIGKTYSAAREFAYHATGEYPDWWQGVRFKRPVRMWALGVTGEQIRDVIQKELCGDSLDGPDFGTGAIPLRCIDIQSVVRAGNTKGLIKDFKVKHVSGGYTSVSFKAYSQGQGVLMGAAVDFIWIDEEPVDQTIYPQCLTRTATGNDGQGGQVVLTFTPENGRTPLVCQFLDDIAPGQYIQNVTWDDAPHITDEVKEQLLAAIPEYQRDMRAKGIPVLGSGVIYPVSDDLIKCAPFVCPDHFYVIDGCDFGWDHPQAHVQLWFDLDEQITYVAHAWSRSERDADQAWTAVKPWANGVLTAWPHDGHQHEKGGGEQLKTQYQRAGFTMLMNHATHPEGGNSVESGLWQILQDMRDGRFKVFDTLTDWFNEKRLYHRDDRGKIVKTNDDLLDATRYAYMMRRYAEPMGMIKRKRNATDYGGKVQSDFDPYA